MTVCYQAAVKEEAAGSTVGASVVVVSAATDATKQSQSSNFAAVLHSVLMMID